MVVGFAIGLLLRGSATGRAPPVKSRETRLLPPRAPESTANAGSSPHTREKPGRQVEFALPKRASPRNTAVMSRPAPYILAVLAALAAAMLWGTTGTLQSLLPADRQPLVVGALRVILGAAALM